MISLYLFISLSALFCFTKSSKILIVTDDASRNSLVIKAIHGLNQGRFKVDEISCDNDSNRFPKIVRSDNGKPLYHTIYYFLKDGPVNSEWGVEGLADFVGRGGNLLTSVRDAQFLGEFGIDLLEGISMVGGKGQWNSNHVLFDSSNQQQEVNINDSNNNNNNPTRAFILRNRPHKPNFNPLIHSALTLAPGSAICVNESTCISNNKKISLLATLETRRGSRFAAVSSNQLLAALSGESLTRLLQWVQGELGVMKIESVDHRLVASDHGVLESIDHRGFSDLNSTIYRVSDWIALRLCLHPRPSEDQVQEFQVELKLMKVQVRKSFESLNEDGCLVIESLQLPTRPGVYTLQIHHNRPGQSLLSHEERILVRPYRTEEATKWTFTAIPYHISWLITVAVTAFFLLPQLFPSTMTSKMKKD